MALKYRLIQRGNPGNSEAPKKFYANAVTRGEITTRQLAQEIASISTVSAVDIMAMIEALLQMIPKHIIEGEIVRLGEFGSFSISITSNGSETEAAFHSSLINKPKMVFRPSQEVKKVLTGIKYEKE